MLPLPFTITGSSCTKKHVLTTLSHAARSLEIYISPATSLRFDLDFHGPILRRLFIRISHPSSGFTSGSIARPCVATQIDAGLNFILWLTGRNYDPKTFHRAYSQAGPPAKKSAPFAELYAYITKEREEERILSLQEYTPSFLSWVHRYLCEDPAAVLLNGSSIAGAALLKLRTNMSVARQKYLQATEAQRQHIQEQKKRATLDAIVTVSEPTLFHGQRVLVLPSGTVKLTPPGEKFKLTFRMAAKEAKRIISLGEEPIILFEPFGVALCVGDSIVYRKPFEWLLTSASGEQWLLLITSELTALKVASSSGVKCHESPIFVRPHDSRLGTRWKNGELQRKLLLGSIFPCTEISNKGKTGRVYFRGVQLYIPREADFSTVYVQCDLVSDGLLHPNACPTTSISTDPANRLGIRIQFNVKGSTERREYWATMAGDCNVKILNSLVDFLEDKDEKWTELQPRRFLPRSITKRRKQTCYTA